MVIPQHEHEDLHRGRLIAVDHVHIQAPPNVESQVEWFYGELIGLRPAPPTVDEGRRTLRFRSDQVDLCIAILAPPEIESVACRVHCEVASLDDVAAELTERGHEFESLRGLSWTDRHLSLLDPAGNRVHVRQKWRPTM
ncbi:MAG: VOC family protein [Phycisphaerales bacterium]|nr:VOC family protein [Phycisphaerales bacterium]